MIEDTEQIVLVDNDGKEIGIAPKLASHHAATPLHKAFSCYIFNPEGQLLVTRRADSKKVWPGMWTNSCCGHPAPGESHEAAVRRRVKQELALELTDIQVILPDYRYKTPPFNGIVEYEVCPVFAARTSGEPKPDPKEISDYRWTSWEDYQKDITKSPDEYSYWAKDQLPRLGDNKLLHKYME